MDSSPLVLRTNSIVSPEDLRMQEEEWGSKRSAIWDGVLNYRTEINSKIYMELKITAGEMLHFLCVLDGEGPFLLVT